MKVFGYIFQVAVGFFVAVFIKAAFFDHTSDALNTNHLILVVGIAMVVLFSLLKIFIDVRLSAIEERLKTPAERASERKVTKI